MITRRVLLAMVATVPVLKSELAFGGKTGRETIVQLQYPPPLVTIPERRMRRSAPTPMEIEQTRDALALTPTGPRPIDIAQSFIDRYYERKPSVISQRPPPAALNPLIAEFLAVTARHPLNDPVPWCAAFINFCIRRNGGVGSSSAWSQSFLPPAFDAVESPQEGDLAVFTCVSSFTGKDIGLGHVAFFRRFEDEQHLVVVGGNQATQDHSSIISQRILPIGNKPVRRHTSTGKVISAMMHLNQFVRPA
ncbi:CHAP domain-containing protein (plasmid) [Rhizobium sp. CB3171]|uniref:CHAP domain-containing protein n=1 Tax=Rhizobium sp. CB3171 TaxID=3039157 RepID=UPI0024B0D288|nr:CHAP domain-containing protein [Rhizobium sp. CB3171]WFU05067.1 CHAP domain-containing protein [Rhizobium sp. CB3171]